jgi:hypothetical protein
MLPKLSKFGRIKPRLAKQPAHKSRVAGLGCVVCRAPAEIHHVRTGLQAKDDRRIVGLCPGHHRHNADSFHQLGSNARFLEVHGIDLVIEADLQRILSINEGILK